VIHARAKTNCHAQYAAQNFSQSLGKRSTSLFKKRVADNKDARAQSLGTILLLKQPLVRMPMGGDNSHSEKEM